VTRGPALSIVVPTLNEKPNIQPLLQELEAALDGIAWEVIFVDDDSTDMTARHVREIGMTDARVRCLQRIGRRGLSSACVEGMLAATGDCLAVMDGDLQHDPAILPAMLERLRSDDREVVVGSRYLNKIGVASWSRERLLVSRFAAALGRPLVPAGLSDPMSGFFILRRSLLDEVVRSLSLLGFKLLLDIFASARRPLRFAEVAYVFRNRRHGDSKLDAQIAWEYLMLLADKLIGRYVPVRFVAFAAVGSFGVAVHVATLWVLQFVTGRDFASAQTIATLVAMVSNYSLNNLLTYRDQRRRGLAWFTGLASFVLVCSVGALANVGVAVYLFNRETGWLLSALAGIAVGVVWNYAVTSAYTWGRRR
jgi:dolichol-phosphate mannosyltransferase